MNFKTTTLAAVAALILSPAVAMADEIPLQVTVEAIVPNQAGLQITDIGGWASNTQRMSWNGNSLDPIRQQVLIKSGLAADVTAYLQSPASITSGGDSLQLTVAVAGEQLPVGAATAPVVATQTEAGAGKAADIVIAAVKPSGDFVQGNYQGNVFMMFESVAP